MKRLVILALALITFQANAQDNKKEKRQENKKERLEQRQNLDPQDMAQLQTKKMTLHLDLTEAQQQKVMALNLENAKKRKENFDKRLAEKDNKERVRPTKEEKLERMNAKLDAQIEAKKKMKTILTAEQYTKWEKSLSKREHGRKHMKKGSKNKKDHKKEDKSDN
ncbi:hypothetical protein V6251_14895 [Olleya sp. Ti.3.14]|uniref:hypothetical protein n=1 Tax=Olleya sp. Ti.3.14 TaxID=3121297 RepID=UPI00311F79DC